MAPQTLQVVLAKRPTAHINPAEHFALQTLPPLEASSLQPGQVLVETLYLSLDPVSRKWLEPGLYVSVDLGAKMAGIALVRVLASQDPDFTAGDFGRVWSGWATHAVVKGSDITKIDVVEGTRPADYLGYLGYTGLTGYFGIERIGKPKAGETVVVSTAAGATGSIAAQTAKNLGAGKVVGITGSDDKVRWLKEVAGLDEALNYRDADFKEQFAKAVPDGIDVYFDNGELTPE
jgi:NADPH-dependent curcumin reductase CurA